MRVIDGDALKESVRKKFKSIPDRCEINELVNAASTIDAIPVAWLRNEMNMADDRGDSEMTDAISWLLQTWQEEQEAR
jgi:hypothetical protein